MASIRDKIGRIIKENRKLKGFSQKELATAVGSEQEHISKLENGKINPSADYLEKLAHVFDKDLFISFEDKSDITLNP